MTYTATATLAEFIQHTTLRDFCSRTPDWISLAQEIGMVFYGARLQAGLPHYRRAILFGPLPMWHIVIPNPDPPAGLPARWCYLIIDCRELKESRRAGLFSAYPDLENALELVLNQLHASFERIEPKKAMVAELPDNRKRWSWFTQV